MNHYYSVSVAEFTDDGQGTTRLWFIAEEAMRAIEAACVAKFGQPNEGLSPSMDEPTIVMLADPS